MAMTDQHIQIFASSDGQAQLKVSLEQEIDGLSQIQMT